jgi:hypothetical protein
VHGRVRWNGSSKTRRPITFFVLLPTSHSFRRIKQTPSELRIFVEAAESPGDYELDVSSLQGGNLKYSSLTVLNCRSYNLDECGIGLGFIFAISQPMRRALAISSDVGNPRTNSLPLRRLLRIQHRLIDLYDESSRKQFWTDIAKDNLQGSAYS